MKIISWNVAGLRARIQKNDIIRGLIENNGDLNYFDIVCLQETKCTENQVKLPDEIISRYPYRYWNSTDGTTQRIGFSGTSIWCKDKPLNVLKTPDFDHEGRIIAIEFDEFIIINVYVPNSQQFENNRYIFRQNWDNEFSNYLNSIETTYNKKLIICGDFNVAYLDIDITNPTSKKNKVPGFFDIERYNFKELIIKNNLIDVIRQKDPHNRLSTYWSNFQKSPRKMENGWRLDYFLISKKLYDNIIIKDIKILIDITGSDHCPIYLEI